MKQLRSNFVLQIVGSAALLVGMSAITVAQTADPAKAPNPAQASKPSSATQSDNKKAAPKNAPATAATAAPAAPSAHRASNAPNTASDAALPAPAGWVPPAQTKQAVTASKTAGSSSQKGSTSGAKPSPKEKKSTSTSAPKTQ
jgi:hypothetical protein